MLVLEAPKLALPEEEAEEARWWGMPSKSPEERAWPCCAACAVSAASSVEELLMPYGSWARGELVSFLEIGLLERLKREKISDA